MNLQFTTEELLEPINAVIGVVEKKESLPIYSHILLELKNNQLTAIATNTEIEITHTVSVSSNEKASFTIYAHVLINILNKLSKEAIINLTIKETKIHIKINKNSFELNTFNNKEFPRLTNTADLEYIKINKINFKNLINKIKFSIASNDIREYLNGLFLEIDNTTVTAVTTDGHRLSVGEIKQENNLIEKKSIILPKKSITEITRILDQDNNEISIAFAKSFFYLNNKNTILKTRLIDANYPDYTQIMPDNEKSKATLNREEFLNSLKHVLVFTEDTSNVKMVFNENTLEIFTHSEKGQAQTKVGIQDFNGKIEINFNAQYLIQALEKINSKEIKMIIPENEKEPSLLHDTNDDDFQYVIMPMRN
jgi:DNA polymerase-3 subunit beta